MHTVLTPEAITETLCRLAAEQAAITPVEVTVDTHLFNDLNFDSLDAVEYTMMIEDEFGVDIEDEKAARVRTIRDAVDVLCPLLES